MDLNSIISEQKTFHTLEIYPLDKDKIISADALGKIIEYIKNECNMPLYKYSVWSTMDSDMLALSNKFKKNIFTVFGKGEYFIDNVWSKVYINGEVAEFNNTVTQTITLVLPDGNRSVTAENGIEPSIADTKQFFVTTDKSFMSTFNLATNLTVLLGQTTASIGSLVGEAATAAKILSVGMTIINEMQTNLNNYGKNKGKCCNLAERCNNIINALQKIPSDCLNLQYIVRVINKIQDSKDLIDEYLKRWRITKFFLSKEYIDQFNATNQNLSDSFYDFAVSYQLSHQESSKA